MTSLTRFVVPSSLRVIPVSAFWWLASGLVGFAGFLIVRACGYDFATVAYYAAYLALHVMLPGAVVMYAVNRGPLSLSHLIALGVPTGFALEIFTYLGLAAIDARALHAWMPLGWAALAVGIRRRQGQWPVRWRVTAHHAGICLVLLVAFLATTIMAASQMFAESPLADGMPTRAIFHDWVYLVSRAAVIKNNWPLDDPSLSGTPLQYHYFMMVHAAAVSATTGIELSAVMLRLVFVPLGAVLVTQAYVLGRAVARSPWGGVMAALLVIVASEVSFSPSYGDPMFLGLFVRWLFVSPTFFFGMIFCGALLIAVARCAKLRHCTLRHYLWLLLLGAAGTGAKGTVLPVVVGALGLWTVWRWWHDRVIPRRLVAFGLCLALAFAVVYWPTMSLWRTGNAAFRPFHVFELSAFWKQHLPLWQQGLAQWLPVAAAKPLASILCAAVVFAGTCGIRLLAIPYLLRGDRPRRDSLLVGWLGAFFIASVGMGVLLELNSHGELYVILMMRLPMAVLTAGCLMAVARRLTAWWCGFRALPGRLDPVMGGLLVRTMPAARRILPRVVAGSCAAALLVILTIQTSLWGVRNYSGLREWLKTPTDLKPDGYMQELQEALLWVRNHTEPNAVLVSNACTPENMKKDHWGALDRTLTGVHFYYSALSERRLWFEGPSYIMDTTRARVRASQAADFFYRDQRLLPTTVAPGPSYILLDRSLADGAKVTLPLGRRVFTNRRMEIYRLSPSLTENAQ